MGNGMCADWWVVTDFALSDPTKLRIHLFPVDLIRASFGGLAAGVQSATDAAQMPAGGAGVRGSV